MRNKRGFTLIELAVVTSIIVTLLGLITINLVRSQRGISLTSVEEILLTDLKQQQLKAMVGDTQGQPIPNSYGIHFDTNRYISFYGPVYSAADSSNFVVNLDSNMQFDNSGFDIVFSKKTGEISSASIIELKDNTNSKIKRIHLNTLGVVNQVESL